MADLLPLDVAETLISARVLADLEDAQLVQLLDDGEARDVALSHGTYSGVLRANLGPIRTREIYRELATTAGSGEAATDHDRMRTTRWRLLAGEVPDADELLASGKLARGAPTTSTSPNAAGGPYSPRGAAWTVDCSWPMC